MFKGVRNDNGRPVGSKNKSTVLIKNTIASILNDNVELFKEKLLQLNDKDFVRAYMDLVKYVIPTMKAVEVNDVTEDNIPSWIDNYNDNHFRQLREYCTDTPSAKIGILTNGIEYKFYIKQSNTQLYDSPFFTFNLVDYDNSDLDLLAMFYKQALEINDIIEEAEEIHFIEKFDDAFYDTLANPSEDFIKIVFKNMGGKRSSEKVNSQIKDLINSISIKNALDKILKKEASESNLGIFTTDEELKSFNVIKTILAMSSKFKNSELDRIVYRDLKNSFTILVDDNQNKNICSLILKENSKSLIINKMKYPLEDVSIASITKYKKEILESALENLA